MMRNKLLAVSIAISTVFAAACGGNESILRSGKEPTPGSNAETTGPSLEKDIETMRTAGFGFIYVLRRKDGGPIDPEDRSVIRVQTQQANRRVSADNGKAVIVGSNFQLAAHNMAMIYQRFAVENYSPDPAAAPVTMSPETENSSNRR